MNKTEFMQLREGDIVQGKSSCLGYVVVANYGNHVLVVRSMEITNPDEWVLIQKAVEQGLHPTSETLPAQEAVSTPEHSATSRNES